MTIHEISSVPSQSRDEFIRLDQFLKVHHLRPSGGAAKWSVQNGEIKVNGETELRRGRKLYHGDTVECDGFQLLVEFDAAQL